MSSTNRHGLPDWSPWDPVTPMPGMPTDTYRMRVPGGWLVRVYDHEPNAITRRDGLPIPHTTRTHVLFVPDPVERPGREIL